MFKGLGKQNPPCHPRSGLGLAVRQERRTACVLAGVLALSLSAQALSQEQGSPVDIIERSAAPPPAQEDPNRLSSLFYELQLMQNEVKKLRGELEQLGHRLDELTRQQSAQYTDVDRRIRSLGGAGAMPAMEALAQQDTPITDTSTMSTVPSAPETEQDAYTQAFSFIEGREFEQAVVAFDQFLIDYPNGEYTPNAFYWLGELHLRLEDLEKSRQSFVQVIRLFPENRKVPDALYKLGVVYDRLGDPETAEEHLQRALNEHPGTTAAQLASEYMKGRAS
ncbi:MAG: tol-pal system protein YbgF [Gammaproteobacteria bacterium]|nr:tol-pal system protein YbgF [Gammaproteobacteria bacterium]